MQCISLSCDLTDSWYWNRKRCLRDNESTSVLFLCVRLCFYFVLMHLFFYFICLFMYTFMQYLLIPLLICWFICFWQAYDPELFSKALPCLSGIGCALSPDYSLSHHDDSWLRQTSMDLDGTFNPRPVDTSRSVSVWGVCMQSNSPLCSVLEVVRVILLMDMFTHQLMY